MATTRKCETCNDQYQNKNLPPCGGCRRYRKWTPQKRPPASEPAPHLLDCGHSSEHLELPPEPLPDFEGDKEAITQSGPRCKLCDYIAELEKKVRLAVGFKSCDSCRSKGSDYPCRNCDDNLKRWTAKGGG